MVLRSWGDHNSTRCRGKFQHLTVPETASPAVGGGQEINACLSSAQASNNILIKIRIGNEQGVVLPSFVRLHGFFPCFGGCFLSAARSDEAASIAATSSLASPVRALIFSVDSIVLLFSSFERSGNSP